MVSGLAIPNCSLHVILDPGDLAGRIPVGRLGTPAEVADLAMAMLRNGYLTNQVIGVDGGLYPH